MRCAVLGSPIAHSLSPAMHRAAYAELGPRLDLRGRRARGGRARAVPVVAGRRCAGVLRHRTAQAARRGPGARGERDRRPPRRGQHDPRRGHGSAVRQHRRPRRRGGAARARRRAGPLGAHPRGRCDRGLHGVRACRRWAPNAWSSSYASRPAPTEAAQVAKAAGLAVTIHTIDEPLIDKLDLLISTVPGEVVGSRSPRARRLRRARCSTSSTTRGRHRWPRPRSRPAYASCRVSTCWRTRPRSRWSS